MTIQKYEATKIVKVHGTGAHILVPKEFIGKHMKVELLGDKQCQN